MASSNTASAALALAKPFADSLGLEIWDVLFVKEGSNMILRFLIDKDGGINITDCENLSRAIDKPLDDADLISCAYTLEVSSTGPERELTRPEHFQKMKGKKIKIRLIRPAKNGEREITGDLENFADGALSVLTADGESIKIKKSETAFIRLYDGELFNIGGISENE